MKRVAWLWALLPVVALGCMCGVPSNLAFCSNDSECAEGQRCDDGVCTGASTEADSGVCLPQTACPTDFCGTFDAGCGSSLECGCANGLRCGASGVPNLCGACVPDAGDAPDDFFLDSDCDGIDGKAPESLFVSPLGSDQSGDGGRFSPLRSLGVAIPAAGDRPILLDDGEYDVAGLALTGRIALHGGYRSDAGWARDAVTRPILRADATGLLVQAPDASVVIDRCEINSADSDGGSGGYAAAVVVRSSMDVQLRNCILEAGAGALGLNGSPGAQGLQGARGGDGAAGSDNGSGGPGAGGPAAQNPECTDASGGDGGRGGAGLSLTLQDPGASGDRNAALNADGGSGGPAVCTTCSCENGDGGVGADGPAGAPGSSGSGGSGFGSFSFADGGFYLAPRAGTGGKGGNGAGGGGGGGGASAYVGLVGTCAVGTTPTGGGGGGAGAGGCGGAGGLGGVGGGPSIALMVLQSHVFLGSSVLRTRGGGSGGEGGRGGNGGAGGDGGNGGKGGSNSGAVAGSGGPGGKGGEGGRGGAGGGGVGGYSLGIYCEGAVLQSVDAGTALGPAGQGGASLGIAGSAGQAAATLGCP